MNLSPLIFHKAAIIFFLSSNDMQITFSVSFSHGVFDNILNVSWVMPIDSAVTFVEIIDIQEEARWGIEIVLVATSFFPQTAPVFLLPGESHCVNARTVTATPPIIMRNVVFLFDVPMLSGR